MSPDAIELAVEGVSAGAALVEVLVVVFGFDAADDAREVDVCPGLLPPVPGVFAFATLKPFRFWLRASLVFNLMLHLGRSSS
ncbi:MAG TPA: hypothetical protein ENH56_01225 [Roseobacter sp.]|nr:hypothetical protein [Roseobacter sp.]